MRALRLDRAVFALMLAAVSCHETTGPQLGPLARIDVASGDAQTAAAGTALPTPLMVIVKDDAGNPLPGQVVNFVVVSGGGSIFAPAVQTNADGKAQNQWTLGTDVAQVQKVEVRAVDPTTGAAVVYATFTATVRAGAAAQLVKVAGDEQVGSITAPLADSLIVKAVDAYGNPAPNVSVAWTSADGSVLSPASSLTRADGTTRALWTTGTHVNAVVTATVAGAAPAGFNARAEVTAATNAVIALVSGDGQTVASGAILPQPLIISVKLPDGRPIVGARAGFRLTSVSVGSAWSTVTGDNGVIALGGMLISGTAGAANMVAGLMYPGQDAIIGTPIPIALTITPGAPTSAAIQHGGINGALTGISTEWIPGTALTTTSSLLTPPPLFTADSVQVLVKDAVGNPTPGVTVTWTTEDGAVVRPATTVTGVDGKARTHFVASLAQKSRIYASVGLGTPIDSSFIFSHLPLGVVLGLSPASLTLAVGAEGNLVVQMDGVDVDSDFLTWTSSDSAVATVATVDPRGTPARAKVTAHAAGTTTLTAAIGTVTGSVTVTVTP